MPDELSLLTPVNDVYRRDVDMADPTLINPSNANALLQGEWVVRDTAHKGVRPTTSVRGCYQVFSLKGDTSAQALGKVTVLQLHEYEADTTIFATGFAGAVGDPVAVKTVDIGDGIVRAGLAAAVSGDAVYGVVTKLPANNGGKLRFQRQAGTYMMP